MLKNLDKVNFFRLELIKLLVMRIGYARISTLEHNLDFQKDALESEDCDKIIVDTISGSVSLRPGLDIWKKEG
ncbi:hypothetical protein OKW21_003024 [Catalinimonas alkaloidigena]|nr:hypothetical protein [Catalinimonas alkaloidigena]